MTGRGNGSEQDHVGSLVTTPSITPTLTLRTAMPPWSDAWGLGDDNNYAWNSSMYDWNDSATSADGFKFKDDSTKGYPVNRAEFYSVTSHDEDKKKPSYWQGAPRHMNLWNSNVLAAFYQFRDYAKDPTHLRAMTVKKWWTDKGWHSGPADAMVWTFSKWQSGMARFGHGAGTLWETEEDVAKREADQVADQAAKATYEYWKKKGLTQERALLTANVYRRRLKLPPLTGPPGPDEDQRVVELAKQHTQNVAKGTVAYWKAKGLNDEQARYAAGRYGDSSGGTAGGSTAGGGKDSEDRGKRHRRREGERRREASHYHRQGLDPERARWAANSRRKAEGSPTLPPVTATTNLGTLRAGRYGFGGGPEARNSVSAYESFFSPERLNSLVDPAPYVRRRPRWSGWGPTDHSRLANARPPFRTADRKYDRPWLQRNRYNRPSRPTRSIADWLKGRRMAQAPYLEAAGSLAHAVREDNLVSADGRVVSTWSAPEARRSAPYLQRDAEKMARFAALANF